MQIVQDEPCVCPSHGWCERHKFMKLRNQWRLCKDRADYRRLWDLKAPLRTKPKPKPLELNEVEDRGDETFIRVGIGDLVAAAARKIGFVSPCTGCKERQRILNRVSVPFPKSAAPEPLRETTWIVDHQLPSNYGVKDDRWAIGVTTAYRSIPKLLDSLRSLCYAGFTDIHVFAEPGSTIPQGVPGIELHDHVRGVFQNWRYALETIYNEKPNAEYFAVFQDDVIYSRNLKAFLENDLWSGVHDVGFVSPYRSGGKTITVSLRKSPTRRKFNPSSQYIEYSDGIHESAHLGTALWGALTYIFPKSSVEIILADEDLKKRERMIDMGIHPVLAKRGLKAWYYTPSLADHYRGPSSIGHGQGQGMWSDNFQGEEFDCLTLQRPQYCNGVCHS